MRQRPTLDHERDFGRVELLFRIVVRIPVDFDLRQMLDRIIEILLDMVLNRLLVGRKQTCDRPSGSVCQPTIAPTTSQRMSEILTLS